MVANGVGDQILVKAEAASWRWPKASLYKYLVTDNNRQPDQGLPATAWLGVFVPKLESASLNVWEKYFPDATIVGADINPKVSKLARDRVSISIIDQSNLQDLCELGIKHGPFDIIIDDGSHMWEHQITTLRTLFPFLSRRGLYVIEDLQTNYGRMSADFRGVSSISCVDYLKRLVDLRVADEQLDVSKEEDPFLRTYARQIDFLVFCKEACLIQKGNGAVEDELLVSGSADIALKPSTFIAHIGGYGDRHSNSSVIRGRGQNQNIQGFKIQFEEFQEEELHYKVRLSNGDWTDWIKSGEFAGTRSCGSDLTGFAVRLSQRTSDSFDLEVFGAFRDQTAHVTATNGLECTSKTGAGALWAIQILLTPK